ncbi:unnamed protein product [Vicia faba]|uniref:F-box domain-containing protein n=1 Tax=Vicia faba TaxID=3906 RepID=A0AAV0YCC6_VICFA|nr:unnamed protein product [Vicia faba]
MQCIISSLFFLKLINVSSLLQYSHSKITFFPWNYSIPSLTMGRKQKKSTRPRQIKIDTVEIYRISGLPDHVIDQILSYLPIREAVRTSVLSKIWKNKWYTLPNLVFDKHGVSDAVNESMLLKIVDHVLLVHSGPINMFKFVNEDLPEILQIDMDRWILHLTGSFEKSFQLVTVTVDSRLNLSLENNQSTLHRRSSNLLDFLDRRPHLQSLVIGSCFLKYLAAGVLPVKLPTPCIGLTYLSLSINFDDLKEISAALCLLKSSPNLKKLEIYARIEHHTVPLTPVGVYYRDDTFSRPDTPIQVRHVTIDGISGFQPELDMIRFLLLYSPVLEKMIVKPIVNVRPELVPQLIRFKRASGEAEVIYEVVDSS